MNTDLLKLVYMMQTSAVAEQLYIMTHSQREKRVSTHLLEQDRVLIYICKFGGKCEQMFSQWILPENLISAY